MRAPRRATAFLLAAGSVAGSLLVRRRRARLVDHVDLYAGDGSVVSLAAGDPAAERLLAAARDLLAHA